MAKEILSIPEEYLGEVIEVIRSGIASCEVYISNETIISLLHWCEEKEEYLKELQIEEK